MLATGTAGDLGTNPAMVDGRQRLLLTSSFSSKNATKMPPNKR